MNKAQALIIVALKENFDEGKFYEYKSYHRINDSELKNAVKRLNHDDYGLVAYKNSPDDYSYKNLQIMAGAQNHFEKAYEEAKEIIC